MVETYGKFVEAYFLACASSFEFYLDTLKKISEMFSSGYTHHKEIMDAYEEGYNNAKGNISKIMLDSIGTRSPANIYF